MSDFMNTTIEYLKRGLRWVGVMAPEPTEEDKANEWLNRILDAMEFSYDAQAEAFKHIDMAGPEYIRGNQARFLDVPPYWIPAVDNVIAPLVNQDQAILASRQPDIACSALDQATAVETEATKLCEGHLRWQMRQNIDVQTLQTRAHDDGAGYGWWVTQAWWDDYRHYDDKAQEWTGQVRAKLTHPMTFRGDPQAEHWKEMKGRFVKCLIPTNDLLRRYADRMDDDDKTKTAKAKKRAIILAAAAHAGRGQGYGSGGEETGRYMVTRSDPVTETAQAPYIASWTGENEPGRVLDAINKQFIPEYPTGPDDRQTFASSLVVMEAIWDDYTTEVIPSDVPLSREEAEASGLVEQRLNADGDMMDWHVERNEFIDGEGSNWPKAGSKKEVPVYPHGRHVIRVGEKGILEDEPWPYERSLWTIGLNGYLPHTWRGENDVERCRPAQDVHNIEAMAIRNFKDNFLAPTLKIAEGSNPKDTKNADMERWFKARPGAAVSVTREGFEKIGFIEYPALPKWVQDEHARSEQSVKDQYGQHNNTEGKESQHQKTLGEIQLITANDRYRTGLKGILVDQFTVDLMEQVWELCRSNLEVGERIRIIDERGAGGWEVVTQEMLDAQFEIDLETTTALPMDRQIRREEATQFMQAVEALGDPRLTTLALKWVVKAFDPPDADEFLKDIESILHPPQPQPGQTQPGMTPEGAPPNAGPTPVQTIAAPQAEAVPSTVPQGA